MWECLRLFQRDVGMLAPISDRCGTACAYLRQMWDSLRLFEIDVWLSQGRKFGYTFDSDELKDAVSKLCK